MCSSGNTRGLHVSRTWVPWVQGARCHGYRATGSRFQGQGSRFQGPGSRVQVPGSNITGPRVQYYRSKGPILPVFTVFLPGSHRVLPGFHRVLPGFPVFSVFSLKFSKSQLLPTKFLKISKSQLLPTTFLESRAENMTTLETIAGRLTYEKADTWTGLFYTFPESNAINLPYFQHWGVCNTLISRSAVPDC